MSKRRQDKHFEFGPFRLDPDEQLLLREGRPVQLPPKAFETLLVLVERSGHLVEKDDLMKAVWPDTFVEEGNLTVHVAMLRKALGELAGGESYIETVPRRGYRFTADVRHVGGEGVVLRRRTRSRILATTTEEGIADLSSSAATQQDSLTTRPLKLPRHVLPVTTVVVVLVMAALGYLLIRTNFSRGATAAPVKSIAVLPFKTIGVSQGSEHQGLGMADILITRLSNLKELNVRPTSAVMAFDNHIEDSVSVGRKLRVDAVLEGTIYRTMDRVRVTARLVRISDQSPIWAGHFEKQLRDELRLQDEMAMQLVDALALPLSGNEKNALTKHYTESADAHNLYLKGRYHWNKRNYSGMVEAERLFRNAIAWDANFALAYVGLADTLGTRSEAPEAILAVGKAVELDPNLAEAHATLGFLQTFQGWKWTEAEASFKKSIELNPGYATAHHWYATLLGILGRTREAKAEMQRALEISPSSYNFLADLGQAHYFARDYEQAKEYCNQSLEIYPDFTFAHQYLSSIYLQTGEYEKMLEENLKAGKTLNAFAYEPAKQAEWFEKFFAAERAIYKQGGIKLYLEHLLKAIPRDRNRPYFDARTYSFLGEKEKALDNLEAAYRDRAFMLAFVKADPIFDNLRTEPRYQIILRNMGLQEF
jgi:DNA-binding winged helix-turn-helix (wHTH) protein/TolB-like protein/lipoprotein NlpI